MTISSAESPMSNLPQNTLRRLNKLPQVPSVWEGDRIPIEKFPFNIEDGMEGGQCIVWVDGTEGEMRLMEAIPPQVGLEAMSRTLIQAMENPQNSTPPVRPQKIVVSDREIQFFLRGALQDLDIVVEYQPKLPILDQLFENLEMMGNFQPSHLSPASEQCLNEIAFKIWEQSPWLDLEEHHLFAIHLNLSEVKTVYACILGYLNEEYGILLYRSLDSLKRFRSQIISTESFQDTEQAFLTQDCWFLNFEVTDADEWDFDEEEDDLALLPDEAIEPDFGSIHPYEGLRVFLDNEEALAVYLALSAFYEFFDEYEEELEEDFSKIQDTYDIIAPIPDAEALETYSISIETRPDIAHELFKQSLSNLPNPDIILEKLGTLESLLEEGDEESARSFLLENLQGVLNNIPKDEDDLEIKDTLIPESSLIHFNCIPWDILEDIQKSPKIYTQIAELPKKKKELPIIVIQSTRPKIKDIINTLNSQGGIKHICFSVGTSIYDDDCTVGLLQTHQCQDNEFYILCNFPDDDSGYAQYHRNWQKQLSKIKGYCGIIFAMGITGANRGQPHFKDFLGFYLVRAINPAKLDVEELGIVTHFVE